MLFYFAKVLFCKIILLAEVLFSEEKKFVLFCFAKEVKQKLFGLVFAKVWFCSQKFCFVSQSLVLFAKALFCIVLQKFSFVRFCGAKVLFYFILVFCFVLLFCFTKVLLNFVM